MNHSERYPLLERNPEDTIAYRVNGPVSAGDFVAEVIELAGRLPDRRYVINLHSDRYLYLLGFGAAIVAGQCMLMPANRQPQTLELLRRTYPDGYTIGDGQIETSVRAGGTSACKKSDYPDIAADQPCAIAFTSGSTGMPRPSVKYWQTLRAGSSSNVRMLLGELGKTINLVATVPPQHMWGMETTVLLPMFGDAAVFNGSPFFAQDIVDALASLPAPRGLVSSPVHLDALLKSGVRVPPIQRVFSATAPLGKSLAMNLEAVLQSRVVDVFGCSESGILAIRNAATESDWTLSSDFELIPTEEGVEIRAGHLSEKVLIPDIVEPLSDGRFRWLGRHRDMINIAGRRGSLSDLNQRLLSIPGVDDGVIFLPEGSDSRLVALVVAANLDVSDILNALRPQVEPLFLPRPLYKVDALPRQETGKLAIKDVNARYQELRKANVEPH